MQLSLQNFTSLFADMAASAQGACTSLLDITVGSVLRAILESSASAALWLQYLILQVLSMTRLATSAGDDVDSWVADFGMTRLASVPAVGNVIMSSLSPDAQSATIQEGALVKTSDGSQTFAVTGGPYVRAQGTPSISVPIVASVAGTSGNVQAGLISILATAIPGIDTVTNVLPLTGGTAPETDSALKARFVTYLNTRSQATLQAIVNAIASVQQGLSYVIQENMTSGGVKVPGHFNVVVDDGSGTPASTLITALYAAIDLVRPIGSSFSVVGPSLVVADIVFSITTVNPGGNQQTYDAVISAVTTYVNGLGVGQALRFSRLAGLAYGASSNVANVISVTVNGSTLDLGGQAGVVVRCGTVMSSVST